MYNEVVALVNTRLIGNPGGPMLDWSDTEEEANKRREGVRAISSGARPAALPRSINAPQSSNDDQENHGDEALSNSIDLNLSAMQI